MFMVHHFLPVGDECELRTQEGRTLDQFIASGCKVEAFLPGYPGEMSSVAVVLSDARAPS
jgi:hypothetical protein